jgi:hypothetical protein
MNTEKPTTELYSKLKIKFAELQEPVIFKINGDDSFKAHYKHHSQNIYGNKLMTWFYEPLVNKWIKFYAIERYLEVIDEISDEGPKELSDLTTIIAPNKSLVREKKFCPKCKKEKSLFAYYKKKNGYVSRCKKCTNEDKADYKYRKENGLPIAKPGYRKPDPAQVIMQIPIHYEPVTDLKMPIPDHILPVVESGLELLIDQKAESREKLRADITAMPWQEKLVNIRLNSGYIKDTYADIKKNIQIQIESMEELITRVEWAQTNLEEFEERWAEIMKGDIVKKG